VESVGAREYGVSEGCPFEDVVTFVRELQISVYEKFEDSILWRIELVFKRNTPA
jgi:hypothetical protein